MNIQELLDFARKKNAADIHICPHAPVLLRVARELVPVSTKPLTSEESRKLSLELLSEEQRQRFEQNLDYDFMSADSSARYRINVAYFCGEVGAVIRILPERPRTIEELFLPDVVAQCAGYTKGLVLITGSTSQGKTTTMAAMINHINSHQKKHIITIEDPVEYHFNGVNQIQVNPRAGITFGNGLRAIMRHDPDVALVGEIRDTDTASIAVQAAMTGHLVLASVHANDSVGVPFRLADLGVEPFLLASALVGVVAQRMVRRICPNCAEEMPASPECREAYYEELHEHRDTFIYGKGCQLCSNTGYLGRTAVMELLTVSDDIKRMLISGASTIELKKKAVEEGMVPMRHDGMLKVQAGITTPDEILRNVFSL